MVWWVFKIRHAICIIIFGGSQKMFRIQAACGCKVGKVRKNNEDNFYIDGKHLSENNIGLQDLIIYEDVLKNGFSTAIFDGMGGENFGEKASYVAAAEMQKIQEDCLEQDFDAKAYLERLAKKLDEAVVDAQQQMFTSRMGTTMVCLFYFDKYMYVCNVGDSRAYLFREGKFVQISCDHTEKRPGSDIHKAAVTQYLGLGSEDVEIEPFIDKIKIENNDIFLLCSDGLSDMLPDEEIQGVLNERENVAECIENLMETAIEHGGRDNITVIVCKVVEGKNYDE